MRTLAPPDQMVFLDDTAACVEGARAARLRAIQFIDRAQAIGELEPLLA